MVESGDDHLLIPQKSPKKPLKCQGQIYKRSSRKRPHDSWLSTWMSCLRPRPVSCADAIKASEVKAKGWDLSRAKWESKKPSSEIVVISTVEVVCAHWPVFFFCTKKRDISEVLWWCRIFLSFLVIHRIYMSNQLQKYKISVFCTDQLQVNLVDFDPRNLSWNSETWILQKSRVFRHGSNGSGGLQWKWCEKFRQKNPPKPQGKRNLQHPGGVKHSLCSPPIFLEKWSNLTNVFQMGWFNHQLVFSIASLKLTARTWNLDGWKMKISLGTASFQGLLLLVSGSGFVWFCRLLSSKNWGKTRNSLV